jgi:tetratricopeptide (TPR) repeat protein
MRFVVGVLVALLAPPAHADDCDPTCRIAKVRDLLERGEAKAARDQLVALYAETKQADLLFALGQVELQLESYEAAIGHYEQFIATNPPEDQRSLAEQAIGAARMRMAEPKVKLLEPPPPLPPPPRRFERRWDLADTVLVIAGGAALAAGGGLLYNANQIGNDASGTLGDYDDRLEHARIRRFSGVAAIAGGVMAIGVAVVRWRIDRTEVTAGPAGVMVGRRW